MDHVLVAIKRLCQAGRVAFTAKAEVELVRDDLTRDDVIESILNADRIKKRLRSANRLTGRREQLYVIESENWDGLRIYTKGKIAAEAEGDRFYVLISSKQSVR